MVVVQQKDISSLDGVVNAGEIQIEPLNGRVGLTHTFKVTLHVKNTNDIKLEGAILQFGDGGFVEMDDMPDPIIDAKASTITYLINHVLPGPGQYVSSFSVSARNNNSANLTEGQSFYIESVLYIDVMLSSLPTVQSPLIFRGRVNEPFSERLNVSTQRGTESITFSILAPKVKRNESAEGYMEPSPNFQIDQNSGDIVWNKPIKAGAYNFVVKIKQRTQLFDSWLESGYIAREMQIIIE